MTVDEVIASAQVDTIGEALERVRRARATLREIELNRAHATDELNRAIVAAKQGGASVRAIGRAAGMGKTQAANIARYGEAGWA